MENFYLIHQDRDLKYLEQLKTKADLIQKTKSVLGNSFKNPKAAESLIEIEDILFTNMADLMAPYLHTVYTSSLVLFNSFENSSESLTELISTISENMELRNVLTIYRKQLQYLDKEIIQRPSITFTNKALSLSLKRSTPSDITDNIKEIFDTIRRILKFIAENSEELGKDAFEEEREKISESLLFFVLKCSEKNFKPYFEKLLKWSKLLSSYTESDTLLATKKYIFLKIVNTMIEKLGKFGISYYGYLFDYFVGYLDNIAKTYSYKTSSTGKRTKSAISDLSIAIH